MRTENKSRVLAAIQTSKIPITVPLLKAQTGLSYNTVNQALRELKAEALPNTWPVEYTLDVIRLDDTKSSQFQIRKIDDPVSTWNASTDNFVKTLKTLTIEPTSDIDVLIDRFRALAEIGMTYVQLLEQVRDKPDWYQLLDGAHEEFDPSSDADEVVS